MSQVSLSWPYRRVVAPALRRLGVGVAPAAPAGSTGLLLTPTPSGVSILYPRPVSLPRDTEEQRARVASIGGQEWYQTIELGHGVRTPGMFDHVPALPYFPLPERLDGKRCLDVATADGFWAFEMERRGAAEVVALDVESWMDLDIPPHVRAGLAGSPLTVSPEGGRFQRAATILGSRARREMCNVYDLTPERFGKFDVVFCGDLLLHLTSPHRALQRVYSVTRGEAIFVEPILPALDDLGLGAVAQITGIPERAGWWAFSRQFLEKAIQLAGFERIELMGFVDLRLRLVPDLPMTRAIFRATPSEADCAYDAGQPTIGARRD